MTPNALHLELVAPTARTSKFHNPHPLKGVGVNWSAAGATGCKCSEQVRGNVVIATAVSLERPVYRGWDHVPNGLCTKTAFRLMRLVLDPDRKPDAYCKTRAGTYALFDSGFAVEMPAPRKGRDYAAIFHERYYGGWWMGVQDACEALFQLNRWAKHYDCPPRQKTEVYALKNRFLQMLWELGYCEQAYLAHTPKRELTCYGCDGTGRRTYYDCGETDECWRCNGTGIYRTVGGNPYWALKFRVGVGHEESRVNVFSWHQPAHLAPWALAKGEQPEEVKPLTRTIEQVTLAKRKRPEAKALIKWVTDQAGVNTMSAEEVPF